MFVGEPSRRRNRKVNDMRWIETPPIVVVTASQFNPSILNPVWLAKNGILNENGEYKPESVFAGPLTQVVTDEYVLVMVAEQLHFIVLTPHDKQQAQIEDKLGKLIKKLPEIPYRAAGLNFNWHMIPEANRVAAETRQLFAGRSDGIFARFAEPDARFGAYLSKDFFSFRMKVDVKPVLVDVDGRMEDRVQFGFNFHQDLAANSDAPAAVLALLGQWDAVRTEATETIKSAGFRELS